MMNIRGIHLFLSVAAATVLALAGATTPCTAAVLFSYDATTGQFPTDQGWQAFNIDTVGPLTAPNIAMTSAANANAAMETIEGAPALHIRDTLTDAGFQLPLYHYSWTPAQQQALLANGLKFTMVFKGLTTTSGGKGNVRFGFNNSEFETQAINIDADKAIEVLGFSAELISPTGAFRTLVITGQMNAGNFELSYTVDGGAVVPLNIITNPSLAAVESSVYFGASSSGNRGTDMYIRSVVMETLAVPEPASAALGSMVLAAMAAIRRRNR